MRAMSSVIPQKSKETLATTAYLPPGLRARVERVRLAENYGLNDFLVQCLQWSLSMLWSGKLRLPSTPPELSSKPVPTSLRLPANYTQEIDAYAAESFYTRNMAIIFMLEAALDQHEKES